MKKNILLPSLLLLFSCYNVERNCKDFKTGKYQSEILIDGVKKQSTSIRTDSMVIETYEGKTDTASIRWINDCEYVLQKLNPKNMAEKKAIDIKILTTSKNSYTFEFGSIGSNAKQKGTATRIN
ncbi:DNA topoisomerase IV [Flavobacterium psychrotolerans]|uniref:DNA topoisomerase IV n=1 Tax=Flavobacterium psychrotolerans TaxID=2169410 RepID=A0A2U1JJL9_9FLAO|nr:DNA topoisomerase IV [Flavobacterium psychrotolerans]PWA05063.1 DNA topoisomerase IV [Flavobacterium psychrotolerans]